jgi:hypothetical protein
MLNNQGETPDVVGAGIQPTGDLNGTTYAVFELAAPVPLPAGILGLLSGLGALAAFRRLRL